MFRYEATTGKLYWRIDAGQRGRAGNEAGCPGTHGYIITRYEGTLYRRSHLAWALTYGEWPVNFMDHINGDTADDRITNLRDVTHRQNHMNRNYHRSGHLFGTTKRTYGRGVRWEARIYVKGKQVGLGFFSSEKKAHEAYMAYCRDNGIAVLE